MVNGKQTLYDVLAVAEDVDPLELKDAWRAAAKKHHPDLNAEDPRHIKRFKRAKRAWAVLSDPEQRGRYDAQLVRLRIPACHCCGQEVLRGQTLCPLCALTVASQAYDTAQVRAGSPEADRLEQEYAWVADPAQYEDRIDPLYVARAPNADVLLGVLVTKNSVHKAEQQHRVSLGAAGRWGPTERRALQSVARSLGRATQWIDEMRQWLQSS